MVADEVGAPRRCGGGGADLSTCGWGLLEVVSWSRSIIALMLRLLHLWEGQ